MSTISSSSGGSTFNIDGLGSGLDTTSIINTLMQIEARPQTMLRQRKAGFDAVGTALTALSTSMTALKVKASSVSNLVDWEPIKATSSNNDYATATGSSGGSVGSISFRVDTLASSNVKASHGTVASGSTQITSATSLTIGIQGGASTSVAVGGGTLDEVVNAINSQSTVGISAAAVKVGDNQYKLQLRTNKAGESLDVDYAQFNDALKGGQADWIQVAAGTRAQITVGTAGSATTSYAITSDSNTFTDVLPGVSIEVKRAGVDVTVTSSRDVDKMTAKVQEFVDAYNKVVGEIAKNTAYDQKTRQGGPLLGSGAVRQAHSLLSEAIIGDSNTTPYQAGIELQRDGTLKFDAAKFAQQFNSDPESVKNLFVGTTGLGTRVKNAADSAVRVDGGLFVSAKDAATKTSEDLQTQIDAYQIRLDRRQLALRRQFTALDTALSSIRSQSGWLSGSLNQN